MNNYVKVLLDRMAKINDTKLTQEHLKVLEYTYHYYEKNRVVPLYFNLKKNLGATRNDIHRLFPNGLNSVYSWLGIPIHTTSDLCKSVPTIKVSDYCQVYLDHNATTYLRPEISLLLKRYARGGLGFGNPSSSTLLGKEAYNLVHQARIQIADRLDVKPNEIIFTGGGSEANNLAIKGIAFQHLTKKGHFITSKTEHPSVLKTMQYLETIGFRVTYLDPDKYGAVSPLAVKNEIRKDTLLVSNMAANNEIGTINPINEIGEVCKDAKIPFMVDAIQGFGKIVLKPKEWGISLMSISGHKIYAPKGIGALFIDESVNLTPLIHGGGQEFGFRSGTENVGSIIALGEAARLIFSEMNAENERLMELQKYFLSNLEKIEPGFILNGHPENRLSNNLSIAFPGIDGGALLLSLNQIGVYVSSGSACSAGSTEKSHVLKAIGMDNDHYGTIRFSFGLRTTKDNLDYLFKYLPSILHELKQSK